MMPVQDLVDRLESNEPQGPVPIRRLSGVQVTADEIREAISANPNHPLAWIFSQAVEGQPGDAKLYCDRADILGLATNRAVRKRRHMVDDELHISKELGQSLEAKKPTPASTPKAQTASSEAQAAEAPASSPRTPRPKTTAPPQTAAADAVKAESPPTT
jgi:hypothetical protein